MMRLSYACERSIGVTSPRFVVARVQESTEEHWRKCVRRKKYRKLHPRRRRRSRISLEPPVEPLELPSNALRWRGEPWKDYKRELAELQRAIYRAARIDDSVGMRALQEALLTSNAAKSLAVRRVAHTHPQRRVPGVDGMHTLDERQQRALRESLCLDGHSDAFLFRSQGKAWKEERGSEEEGVDVCVCTMRNRAKQVLLFWALEPECEAKFRGTALLSHRPGHSVHDLIHWLRGSCGEAACYLMTVSLGSDGEAASVEGVAAALEHQWGDLCGGQLRSWVEAGLLKLGLFPMGIGRHGEEQSCPILPLVSNFLCYSLIQPHSQTKVAAWNGTLIVVGPSIAPLQDLYQHICQQSKTLGLQCHPLSPLVPLSEAPALFKAFQLEQRRLEGDEGYELKVWPRREVVEQHLLNLDHAFRLSEAFYEDKTGLINRLNPIIEAFVHHFSSAESATAFSEADTHLHQLLTQWAIDQNPTLTKEEALLKEFSESGFELATRTTRLLPHLSRRLPEAVDLTKSPYDGDVPYWKERLCKWDYHINPSLPS